MCLHCYSQIYNQPFLFLMQFQESLSDDGAVLNSVECANTTDITFWFSQNIFHEAKRFGTGSLSGRCTCLPSIHLSHGSIAACRHNMTPFCFIAMNECDFMRFSFWLLPVYKKKIQILFLQQ
jgi:hypothetical protein